MKGLGLLVVCLTLAAPALSQDIEFDVDEIACLPLEDNGFISSRVQGDVPGGQVRLYFRRLNPSGGFYWTRMVSEDGDYWAVFPRPESRGQRELTDEWWEDLANRDWMEGRDRAWLEAFLRDQDEEAAEYYLAVHDGFGSLLGRTETRLLPVRSSDCAVLIDPRARSLGDNLTIGETSYEQDGEALFHWLCEGIVTRVDSNPGELSSDDYCRACVVGSGGDSLWSKVVGLFKRGGEPAAADEDLEDGAFPWPPPEPSGKAELHLSLESPPGGLKLRHYREALEEVLLKEGYENNTEFRIREKKGFVKGFAVVTQLERLDETGDRQGFWDSDEEPAMLWVKAKDLFIPRRGRYRTLVFTVTPADAFEELEYASRGQTSVASLARLKSPRKLLALMKQDAPSSPLVTAFVYEFVATAADAPVTKVTVSAIATLWRANLARPFGVPQQRGPS